MNFRKLFGYTKTTVLTEKSVTSSSAKPRLHPAHKAASSDYYSQKRIAARNERVSSDLQALALAIRKQELARSSVPFGKLAQRVWLADTDLVQYLADRNYHIEGHN